MAATDATSVIAEREACDFFYARDSRRFHFRESYSATKDLVAGQHIEKNVMLVSGFRCCTRYWPQSWLEHEPGWIKLSVVVTRLDRRRAKGPKLVAAHIDLRTKNGTPARTAIRQPVEVTGDCFGGVSLVARRDEVEKDCVVDDNLVALCTIAILRGCPPLDIPLRNSIGHDIFNMLDLMDISFEVDGETFKAHRLVLATRSQVFKAELFGHMAESRASSITIEGIRAATFKSMLFYMYHNVLPVAAPEIDDASGIVEFQHLFVAADRYGLDTLKQMCEDILYASISTNTVLPILEFTEEHTCPKLKSKCLDFLDAAENFKEVASTDEYLRVMNTYPSLQVEVRNWFKRARLV